MIEYITKVAAFIAVNDDAASQGLARAKDILGDSGWKSGWNKEDQKVARDCLLEAGADVTEVIVGRVTGFKTVVNTSSDGTEYRKVWLTLDGARKRNFVGINGQMAVNGPTMERPEIVTMDVKKEEVQRLIAKLAGISSGDVIKLSIFPTTSPVRDDGRSYINHAASLKRLDGGEYVELKAPADYVAQAGRAANAAAEMIKKQVRDKSVLWAMRVGAKADYFWDLAKEIEARFSASSHARTGGGQSGAHADDDLGDFDSHHGDTRGVERRARA